jgi:hypothetical protein
MGGGAGMILKNAMREQEVTERTEKERVEKECQAIFWANPPCSSFGFNLPILSSLCFLLFNLMFLSRMKSSIEI